MNFIMLAFIALFVAKLFDFLGLSLQSSELFCVVVVIFTVQHAVILFIRVFVIFLVTAFFVASLWLAVTVSSVVSLLVPIAVLIRVT